MLFDHLDSLSAAMNIEREDGCLPNLPKVEFNKIDGCVKKKGCSVRRTVSFQTDVLSEVSKKSPTQVHRSNSTHQSSGQDRNKNSLDKQYQNSGVLTREYIDKIISRRTNNVHGSLNIETDGNLSDFERKVRDNIYNAIQDSKGTRCNVPGYWPPQLEKHRPDVGGVGVDPISTKEKYVYRDRKAEAKKIGKSRVLTSPCKEQLDNIKNFMSTYTPPRAGASKIPDGKESVRRTVSQSTPILAVSKAKKDKKTESAGSALQQIKRRQSASATPSTAEGVNLYTNTLQALIRKDKQGRVTTNSNNPQKDPFCGNSNFLLNSIVRRKSSGQTGHSPQLKPIFNRCKSVQNGLKSSPISCVDSGSDEVQSPNQSQKISVRRRKNNAAPPRASPRPVESLCGRSRQEQAVKRVQIQPIATVVPTYGSSEMCRKASGVNTLSIDEYRMLMEYKISEMNTHHLSCHNINFDARVKGKYVKKRFAVLNELKAYAASDLAEIISWRLSQFERGLHVKV